MTPKRPRDGHGQIAGPAGLRRQLSDFLSTRAAQRIRPSLRCGRLLRVGSLRREDVGARVKHYIAAHNRMFPTNFAKFGDSPLVSLDEVLFDNGATTRGDTVTRGLWD